MGFTAAVAVSDGVAVASDSRVQARMLGGPPTVMSETHQKIVPLSLRVAALLAEPLYLRDDIQINVRSTLEVIRLDWPRSAALELVISELPGRFSSAVERKISAIADLSLTLVGFSEKERAVKVVYLARLDDPQDRHSTVDPGFDWFGFPDIATRLVKGHAAMALNADEPEPSFEYAMPMELMSLADALELAETLVRTTSTFGRFVRAVIPPGLEPQQLMIPAGGPVQSALVRPQGFTWVAQPKWSLPAVADDANPPV